MSEIDRSHLPIQRPTFSGVVNRTLDGPIQTPNYTRTAQGGLPYNRCHVTALCSPTRAASLTGRNNPLKLSVWH